MRNVRRIWNIPAGALVLWSCAVSCPVALSEDLGHPTLEEFKEEVQRADLIVRGHVEDILDEISWGDNFTQIIKVAIDKIYKGGLQRSWIVVNNRYWEAENKRQRGDDVILFLKRLQPFANSPRPFDQKSYFLTLGYCYYCVKDGMVLSPTGMAKDLAAFKHPRQFVALIEETVAEGGKRARKHKKRQEYAPGRVLFSDDFSDGSMSGWTLLKGARRSTPQEDGSYGFVNGGEIWMAEGIAWKNAYFEHAGMVGRLTRDKAGHLTGERNSTQIQIGVYNGRLRLRSNHLHQHITIVAGNPNWTDYQVDVDMFNHLDRRIYEPRGIAQDDYKTFGVFGRVTVPNLPNTKGEHSEIGVEFGSYSNMDATTDSVDRNTIQVRLKTADADGGRDWATCLRKTKILDCQTYEVPKDRPIHVTAKFMGNRVEGWIDGKKYVEGVIPDSNWSQFQHGRIALWVFETFAEFDNVKVTELVKKSEDR